MEGVTDAEHKKDLQRQQMHLQHKKADMEQKKADTEQLLAFGRLNKEGQVTDIEFTQAKANLLLSQVSMSDARSSMLTTSPTTRFKDVSENSDGIVTALDYYQTSLEPQGLGSMDQLAPTDSIVHVLRQELSGLKLEALRRRAKYAGATAREIERVEDRAALIDLIAALSESLRRELSRLSLRNLLQRAERLAVPHHEIERAEESANVKDRLVELVSRADHRGMHVDQAQHRQDEAASEPARGLDQILVSLRTGQRDYQPKMAFDATDPLANEGVPLLPIAKTKEAATVPNAALTLPQIEPSDEVQALEKRLAETQTELAKSKAEILRQIAATEGEFATLVPMGASFAKTDHSLDLSLEEPRSLVLDEAVQEPEPEGDEEAQAALKVQAMWRGKAGLKKAVEQEHAMKTGRERIVAAKRTIRNSQIAVTGLVMLTTAVSTLLPTYVIGAAYGAVANGEGIDGGISLNFGLRVAVFYGCVNHCQIGIFAWAMRDTAFVPGATERVVRPLLSAASYFLLTAGLWLLLDLQDPAADVALIKGVPGAIVGTVGAVMAVDVRAQPVEIWRLYRARNTKLPPSNAATWWDLTVAGGRGTLVTALLLCGFNLADTGFRDIFLAMSTFWDKAGTLDTYIGEGNSSLDGWWYTYYFAFALPLMLLALIWAKPWPKGARDPVSAVVLCSLQRAAVYQGAINAFHLYAWLGGENGSTLGCQILIEVLMLLLYLYARTLARKAFGAAPTYEARALFIYLLLSDVFAELAFVNVPFLSGEFWVLIAVDFVMLVMRDSDLWDDVAEALRRMFGERCGRWCAAAAEIAAGETDLVADRIGGRADDPAAVFAARKRRLITSRMIASQAVASEFLVTGTFLLVTVGSWVLDTSGATAHVVILPMPPAGIEPGCNACLCDMDGVVAGADIGADGGCVAGRQLVYDIIMEVQSPVSLCPVPKECGDAAVPNATDILQAIEPGWEQPSGFRWRTCTGGDPVSNECDPTTDATRNNALAFVTVFAVQCAAIALGHLILMWKLRRMVAENKRMRRRAMADPSLERRARRFVAEAKAKEERKQSRDGESTTLSARMRFRRAVIVTKFAGRAMKAAKEAPAVESVDDVVLEISEAVATHWKESLPYFVVNGTGAMAVSFLVAGLVVSAQTA
jgi:hypothetical protein